MQITKKINDLMAPNSDINKDKIKFSVGDYICSVDTRHISRELVLNKAMDRLMQAVIEEQIINKLIIDERATPLKDKTLEITIKIV